MEQEGAYSSLSEWARLPGGKWPDRFNQNKHWRVFQSVWRKCEHHLVLDFSPLSFTAHPQFCLAMQCSNFVNWERGNLHKFCVLGNKSGMLQGQVCGDKLGNSPLCLFQYRQIRDLVRSLQRHYDVFCVITDFEKWIIAIEKQKKLLFKMCLV